MITYVVHTRVEVRIKGTLVNDFMSERARNSSTLVIDQPYGPMEATTEMKGEKVKIVGVYRTAEKFKMVWFIPHIPV